MSTAVDSLSVGSELTELKEAHHELDRLQGIVTRHEGFMFSLRGWLLTVVGALLAAYYTANIDMSSQTLRVALLGVTIGFLCVESRHANLVQAVVSRIWEIEKAIAAARLAGRVGSTGWYDGPRVSEVCSNGAHRLVPSWGMTFVLNLMFYVVVVAIILVTTLSLPPKVIPAAPAVPAVSALR